MLEVGNGGMTFAEYRSHFSIWALMKVSDHEDWTNIVGHIQLLLQSLMGYLGRGGKLNSLVKLKTVIFIAQNLSLYISE
jgi:hypothetical protein